jgi:PAS domain S-box-containing protein
MPVFIRREAPEMPIHGAAASTADREEGQAQLEASWLRYVTLFQTTPDAIHINRLSDGEYVEVNKGFTHLTGYTSDDVEGKTSLSLDVWDDPSDRSRLVEQLRRDGQVEDFETRFRRKDGSLVPVLVSSRVIELDGDVCALSVSTDVSAIVTAEDRIAKLNRVYTVLSNVNQALVHLREQQSIFDRTCQVIVEDGGFLMAWVGLVAPDGVHLKPVAWAGTAEGYIENIDIVLGDERRGVGPTGRAIAEKRHVVCADIANDPAMAPWRNDALEYGYGASAAFPLVVNERCVGALSLYALDPDFFDVEQVALLDELAGDVAFSLVLAEREELRRQAEMSLSESEQRYRAVSETVASFVYSCVQNDGEPYRIDWLAGAVEDLTGYTAEEMLARSCWRFMVLPEDAHIFDTNVIGLKPGEEGRAEFRLVRADGAVIWVRSSAKAQEIDGAPGCHRLIGACEDITERKDAEEQRRGILHTAMDGFWLSDGEGRLLEVNDAYCVMSGYTEAELLTMRIADIEAVETESEVAEHVRGIRDQGRVRFESQHRRKDGSIFEVENSVQYLPESGNFAVFLRDVTERKRAAEQLAKALASITQVVSLVSEQRDPYTAGHQRRVSQLAVAFAERMGLSESEIDEIRIAAVIHDVGKMSVPAEILSKPGALSPLQFDLVKAHAEAGYQVMAAANMPGSIAEIVYQHHERCDGSGYPRGLAGDELLMGAKVVAVADVLEAMMSHRPYRPALGIEVALAEIEDGAGSRYDADVAKACADLFAEGDFAFTDEVPV